MDTDIGADGRRLVEPLGLDKARGSSAKKPLQEDFSNFSLRLSGV
jgi:hypothetical protein